VRSGGAGPFGGWGLWGIGRRGRGPEGDGGGVDLLQTGAERGGTRRRCGTGEGRSGSGSGGAGPFGGCIGMSALGVEKARVRWVGFDGD
jgi:hypothetical protein